jgi:hypothetical protein
VDKYLIVFSSENKKLGPILTTSSPRATCPTSCMWNLTNNGPRCYAGKGFFGQYIWGGLDRTTIGNTFGNGVRVWSFAQLLYVIRSLLPGQVWRHNQAGDLPVIGTTIDNTKLRAITDANTGRRGFTFTHHDVLDNAANRQAVKEACDAGFMINLSADSLTQADALADLGIAPVSVVVLPNQKENTKTPNGRTVAICPAVTTRGVTCATCRICTKPHKAIIAFPKL